MTDQNPTVVKTPAERIDEFFRNQRDGRALAEFADALAAVSKGVMDHGKPGTVTLKLTLSPLKNVVGAMRIADQIASKVPAEPKTESIFYGDSAGDLSRSDPRQRSLPGMPGHSDVGIDPTVGLQRVGD